MKTISLFLNLVRLLFVNNVRSFLLDVVHNSDLHASFDPVCANISTCYGGLAQHAAVIAKLRHQSRSENNRHFLFLNNGGSSNGSLLYTLFRNELLSKVLNTFEFNVTSLGDSDFIVGVKELSDLLNDLSKRTNVVVTNMNFDEDFELKTIVKKSVVLQLTDEFKVGVVGYVSKTIGDNLHLENLKVTDDVRESIRAEVTMLKNVAKCNFIVALSHSSVDKDTDIGMSVPEIDLIIGGHAPAIKMNTSTYPEQVYRPDQSFFLIARTREKARYIGHLVFNFSDTDATDAYEYDAQLIEVDRSYNVDKRMANVLKKYTRKMINLDDNENLRSSVRISGDVKSCTYEECDIGGVVADAFVAYFREIFHSTIIDGAIIDSSQFHHDLETRLTSVVRVARSLPYLNKVFLVEMTGNILNKLFQYAATKFYNWHFLQVSRELQIKFWRHSNEKVLSLKNITVNGLPIEINEKYRVLLMRHLYYGKVLKMYRKQLKILEESDMFDYEIVWWYLDHGRADYEHNVTRSFMRNRLVIESCAQPNRSHFLLLVAHAFFYILIAFKKFFN